MDHLRDALLQTGLQHIQGTNDVGINEVARRLIRIWDSNEGAQVKDDLAIGHSATYHGGIGQISEHDLHGVLHVVAHVLQLSPIITRVIVYERAYACTSAHQPFCEMTPN